MEIEIVLLVWLFSGFILRFVQVFIKMKKEMKK